MQARFCKWIYNTSINYLHRERFEIRCTSVKLNKETDQYELTFTHQAKDTTEKFSRLDLENCPRPEPVVKYICNRANHRLLFGEVEV